MNSVVMVLSGRSKELIGVLTERMQAAAESMEFEDAARFRDQIEALEAVMLKQNVDVGEVVDRDIVSVAREERDAVAVVMQIREGVLIGRQDFDYAEKNLLVPLLHLHHANLLPVQQDDLQSRRIERSLKVCSLPAFVPAPRLLHVGLERGPLRAVDELTVLSRGVA